ncbi:hypothetical protein PGIGA_G00008890 [Pangasianodon gigas]|uniref:Uncharacterized protein n=1 Tax=Pangasianodon gigas TaxID=30993 RepID=A0ACC5W8P4_PANGG|nr:hypothetical protein [Pangasianodon gigas]
MPDFPTLTRHETASRTTLIFTGVIRHCQQKDRTSLPVNGIRGSTRACALSAGLRSGMDRFRMEASLERSEQPVVAFFRLPHLLNMLTLFSLSA